MSRQNTARPLKFLRRSRILAPRVASSATAASTDSSSPRSMARVSKTSLAVRSLLLDLDGPDQFLCRRSVEMARGLVVVARGGDVAFGSLLQRARHGHHGSDDLNDGHHHVLHHETTMASEVRLGRGPRRYPISGSWLPAAWRLGPPTTRQRSSSRSRTCPSA